MHFTVAAPEEQELSVQAVDMAVAGMHVVGMVHEDRAEGSQQPWTPR